MLLAVVLSFILFPIAVPGAAALPFSFMTASILFIYVVSFALKLRAFLPVPDLNYGVADAALFLLFLASMNSDFWTKI